LSIRIGLILPSTSAEHRRAFLQECVAAFHGIGAQTDFGLHLDLAPELVRVACMFAFVDQAARCDQRARRAAGELARERQCAVAQRRIVEYLANQSPLPGLIGRDREPARCG
jgi:hypothetical protein